jgi:hypothetical protein
MCISYPEFREKVSDEKCERIFLPLKDLVDGLTPSDDDRRWDRLRDVYGKLADVNEVCRKVLSLPRESA